MFPTDDVKTKLLATALFENGIPFPTSRPPGPPWSPDTQTNTPTFKAAWGTKAITLPPDQGLETIPNKLYDFFTMGQQPPMGQGPPHYWGFTITLKHTTVGRTTLDEWSAWRRDLYLTTPNTHNRQTSMPPAGFEPTIPAGERPQTHALEHAANRTGLLLDQNYNFYSYDLVLLCVQIQQAFFCCKMRLVCWVWLVDDSYTRWQSSVWRSRETKRHIFDCYSMEQSPSWEDNQ